MLSLQSSSQLNSNNRRTEIVDIDLLKYWNTTLATHSWFSNNYHCIQTEVIYVDISDLSLNGFRKLNSSHSVHGHNVKFQLKLIYWLNPTNMVVFIWWLEQDESQKLSFGKGCEDRM